MTESIHDLGQGFWSIRGDLRIGGVLNVGTQASLVRLRTGRFVMLDSYPLSGAIRDTVMDLTDGGRAVEAVLNLHPFHRPRFSRRGAIRVSPPPPAPPRPELAFRTRRIARGSGHVRG